MVLTQQLDDVIAHPRLLLDVLNSYCDSNPDTIACHQVSYKKKEWIFQPLTYSQLREKTLQCAEGLKARGLKQGDRVLLCLREPNLFMVAFLGIMAVGCVPVPLPEPTQFGVTQTFIQRILNVCRDCEPSLIIALNQASWTAFDFKPALTIPIAEIEELEQVTLSPNPKRKFPSLNPEATAFLQYTSGSTGNPKGIVITQTNLAANISAIIERLDIKPGDKIVSWLPLFHDMGLVGGLLTPLYGRMEAHLLTPLSFIMRPASWLRAVSDFRAKYTIGPTYAYNVAANKIPDNEVNGLDLSALTTALVGAEPIDRGTAEAFIKRFAEHGFKPSAFYPVYGMAEATLGLAFPQKRSGPHFDTINRLTLAQSGHSVPEPTNSQEAISFISVGTALRGHNIVIQDPNTGRVLPERMVGQVVATGPSISPYYFAEAKANRDRRRALRTGDLGYFADGNLYIADRLKDLIIIAGQNFIPSDIEAALLENVRRLRLGRVLAFSTVGSSSGSELLRIVAELSPRFWLNQDEIRQEIVSTIFNNFRLEVSEVLFLKPGTSPRTSSGKLQRRACRNLYLEGKLRSLEQQPSKVSGVK